MQLILDTDDIDIKRNMSTIEQESLNEKFLTNKIIEQLPDDISSGNKENIQKQDNIIPDLGERDVLDSSKETGSDNVELKPSTNGENLNDDKSDIENDTENKIENTSKSNDSEVESEAASDDPIILNLIEKEFLAGDNEAKLNKEQGEDKIEELNKENETVLDNHTRSITDGSPIENFPASDKLKTDVNNSNEIEVCENLKTDTEEEVNKESDENGIHNLELDKINDENEQSELASTSKNDETLPILTDIDAENKEIDVTKKLSTEENVGIDIKIDETAIIENSSPTNEKHEVVQIDDEKENTNKENNLSNNAQELPEEMDDAIKTTSKLSLQNDVSTGSSSTVVTGSEIKKSTRFCKLSNNLDIFSDDEEDDTQKSDAQPQIEKKCISIDEDDDIMLIDEDCNTKESKNNEEETITTDDSNEKVPEIIATNNDVSTTESTQIAEVVTDETISQKEDTPQLKEPAIVATEASNTETTEKVNDKVEGKEKVKKPLLPKNFMKTCKKNLADMTRDDLEEFCILKIVESIVDRSNLGEIKAQLKNLTQTMEECKKKCLMLSKQNKDLQIVLKSVQEEQKSASDIHNIAPLKITRSVGMQIVMMADKNNGRKKATNGLGATSPVINNENKPVKVHFLPNAKASKEKNSNNQQIPVPRLVPAAAVGKVNQIPVNNSIKQTNATYVPIAVRNTQPANKVAEKRGRSQSVTVDLTDDEPPAKVPGARGTFNQAVRVTGSPQNIVGVPRYQQAINSPRKVYIPISGPQAQNVRPGQTIMLKAVTGIPPRQRFPSPPVAKVPQVGGPVRLGRVQTNRHPAPLPEVAKQYQPPNWKTLPPPPDLKLSKVENGIVISWKIDGYQEDKHEEIASYQLYAYQETQAPPSTTLWKKIGDVKALPLPMACTLTQFMAGYKYYFAVRAIDIRSRIGPFSLPGSILLLNKI